MVPSESYAAISIRLSRPVPAVRAACSTCRASASLNQMSLRPGACETAGSDGATMPDSPSTSLEPRRGLDRVRVREHPGGDCDCADDADEDDLAGALGDEPARESS